jgi:hypothetical protein
MHDLDVEAIKARYDAANADATVIPFDAAWLSAADVPALLVEVAILTDQLSDSRALCCGHADQRDLDAARARLAEVEGERDEAREGIRSLLGREQELLAQRTALAVENGHLQGLVDGLTADRDAALAELDRIKARHAWSAIYRATPRGGRCRNCSGAEAAHRMHCKHYVGPLEHRWAHTRSNGTFGGIDFDCMCGGWFRLGGMAGHGDGTEQAQPVCPNAEQTWREANPGDTPAAADHDHGVTQPVDLDQEAPSGPLASPQSDEQAEEVPEWQREYREAMRAAEAREEAAAALDRHRQRREALGGSCTCAWNNGHAPAHIVGHHADCPAWVPRPGALGSKPVAGVTPSPGEVAGLEEAVEAVASVIAEANYWSDGTSAAGPSARDKLRAENITRAAAPILVRAALLEAADDVGVMWKPVTSFADWLRDRAARQVTG